MGEQNGGMLDALGRASTLGLHLVSGIIVGGGLGYAVDAWLGTKPWGLLTLLIFGIIAGFRNVWRDARRIVASSASSGTPSSGTPTNNASPAQPHASSDSARKDD